MIKNEREYRITKAQAAKFEEALRAPPPSADGGPELHPLVRKAQMDALRSQIDEFKEQIAEYETLREGAGRQLTLESFDELPRALIKARIAAGLTQRELGERLGLKEQQIQRYEATGYGSASLTRVNEVIKALGLRVREDVFIPSGGVSLSRALARLREAGIDRELVYDRLLSRVAAANGVEDGFSGGESAGIALQLAGMVKKVFGWTSEQLFGTEPLPLNPAVVGGARFKVAARTDERRLRAYSAYAHHLAGIVLRATEHLPPQPIPLDPLEVRKEVITRYGSLTFEHALNYVWSLGVPVLPLNDRGAFHGAFWRIGGRNVIVLKQTTASTARWLHDLLHEFFHAGQEPTERERTVIETGETPLDRRTSEEEQDATSFASDILLAGRAEELAEKCVEAARGSVESLKGAVPRVAAREGVRVDALANYLAFRLAIQGIQWWPTATKLQAEGGTPWKTARDICLQHMRFDGLTSDDRELLGRALTDAKEP